MTAREAFNAVLFSGPLIYADAIVVLSGDGTVRLDVAVGALRQRSAHWCVVSGGLDNPPHSLHASEMRAHLIREGLAADRIICESWSQNTHDQAEALAVMCKERDWTTVLLATSPYHMPRAFLTVLQSLTLAGLDETVHVIPLAASQTTWWGKPEGLDFTRFSLLAEEYGKIRCYQAKGHTARYEAGLDYLKHWEAKVRK